MAGKQTEQIKYETEILRLIVLVGVAIGGGSLSLLLGELAPLRAILSTAGILATLVLAVGVWRQNRRIRELVSHLEEK